MAAETRKHDTSSGDDKFDIALGETLLRAGLLSQEQLAQAMWERSETQQRLEDICIRHNWIPIERLYSYVPSYRLRLGELLVLYGLLSFSQLQIVLADQDRYPQRKLGELLVEYGLLKSDQLFWSIQELAELRQLSVPNTWELVQHRSPYPRRPGQSRQTPVPSASPPARPASSTASPRPESHRGPIDLSSDLSHYQQRIKELEQQLAQQRRQEQEKSRRELQAGQTITELHRRIRQLEEQLQERGSRDQQQESVEQDLRRSLSTLQERLQQTQIQVQEQQSRNEQLTEQLKVAQARISILDNQLVQQQMGQPSNVHVEQALRQTITTLQQQLQTTQMSLQNQQVVNQQLSVQHSQDQELLHAWGVYQEQVEAQLAAMQQKSQESGGELDAARTQVEQLQAELEHNRLRLEQLEKDLEEKQSLMDRVQAANARLISDLAEARRQSLDYQQQLQSLTSPSSAGRAAELESMLAQEREKNAVLVIQMQEQRSAHIEAMQNLQEKLKQQQSSPQDAGSQPAAPTSLPPADPKSTDSGLDADEITWLTTLPIWAEKILSSLRQADLLSKEQLQAVIGAWDQEKQSLTDVLNQQTALKVETIRFFSEEGFSAKFHGSRGMGELLRAAGLVSEEALKKAQSTAKDDQALCQALVDQGVLSTTTAEYFNRSFHKQQGRDPGRKRFRLLPLS